MFAVNTDGTGFTNLYSFTARRSDYTNSDGAQPVCRIDFIGQHPVWDGTATAAVRAMARCSSVNTDGTGFTTLHSFTHRRLANSDGAEPYAGLILSGNTLYGTAGLAAVWAMARCSRSTPMAQVLRPCIVFRSLSLIRLAVSASTTTELSVRGLILSGNTLYGTALMAAVRVWHGVQSFTAASQLAATDIFPSGAIRYFDVADQCHRVHFAIHHEPCFTGGLDHRFAGAGGRQRAEHSDQSHLRAPAVFPVKPVVKELNP